MDVSPGPAQAGDRARRWPSAFSGALWSGLCRKKHACGL